ncbi:MAG: glycosyltransferase family 4 protein [Anaerolineales bacterium]
MKICLISVEIFAWGKYGGFGRSTRMLGRELARRGVEVTAIVPRRRGQRPVEDLDGIHVLGFEPRNPFSAIPLIRAANADVYHSQEPSFTTFLARSLLPAKRHVVTFRDTRDLTDWWIEWRYPSLSRLQVLSNLLFEDNALVHSAVRHADACFAAARMLIPKARKKYRLPNDPQFLPSPVPFPEAVRKSDTPLVCFVGRLDRRKRPQLFFDLAEQFPAVQFVAAGSGRDARWEQALRSRYGYLPNVRFLGFVDQFDGSGLSDLLSRSWVLVNTSAREGLPTSFIEAAGHGCAILSEIDPDGFATQFGYHAAAGNFAQGLQHLLRDSSWQTLGARGRAFVQETFSINRSLQEHIRVYERLLH